MSFHKHRTFDEQLHNVLHAELGQVNLSQNKKEDILNQWQEKKKTFWQHLWEWGEEEVTISLSNLVTVCLVFVLVIGGAYMKIGPEMLSQERLEEELVYYKVVQTIYDGDTPIGERGKIISRRAEI